MAHLCIIPTLKLFHHQLFYPTITYKKHKPQYFNCHSNMGPTDGEVNDDPVAPPARLFLRPEMNTIIHCVIAGKNPFNVDAVKSTVQNSAFLKHQRFTSLLVTDRHGREYWRETKIDINCHVIVYDDPVGDVNDYVADLSSLSSPLNTNKPLWELHLLMAHNCAIFRVHHSLVDGTSFMSMLLSCCRSAHDNSQLPQLNGVGKRNKNRDGVWKKVMALWFTLVFLVEFGARIMWLKDKRTVVSGGAGVELWPRKLATAKFRIEDMKIVKNAVAHATINDVLCGVISSGLTKYLDTRSDNALREEVQLTGLVMVNLRPQPGLQDVSDLLNNSRSTKWGNESGLFLLPFPCRRDGSDPLQYLKRAKPMIDLKKQSFEAYFIYRFGCLVMNILGSKLAGFMTHRICCNTTFAISNMVGPKDEVSIAGNPIEHIRVNTTGPQAITMHMLSYADRADMQILVAKDIIPDPQVLANYFEDALLEMKESAQATKHYTS